MVKIIFFIFLVTLNFNSLAITPKKHYSFSGSLVLFPLITRMVEDYALDHSTKAPIVETIGTGPGFRLFCLNKFYSPQFVMASRPIKNSEVKLCHENGIKNIVEYNAGRDALVLIYGKTSKLNFKNISSRELSKILTHKEINYWQDINSSYPNKKIKIYGPNSNSGGFDNLKTIINKYDKEKNVKFDTYIENGTNQNMIIQKVINDPYGLGLIDLGYYNANKHSIKVIAIDKFAPTAQNIASGKYAINRLLNIYYNQDLIDQDYVFKDLVEYMQYYYKKQPQHFIDLGIISNKLD